MGVSVLRVWLLCLVLIIAVSAAAGCTSTGSAAQPTLRGPVVPTRVIPTATNTHTPTNTPQPTDTPVPTDTNTPEPPTLTPQPTDTPVPTDTNTPEPPTLTPQPTDTPIPTDTNTPEPTQTPSAEPVPYRNATSPEEALIYGAVTLDSPVYGTIDEQHAAVLYTFDGTAGMVIDVSMTKQSGNLDCYLLVLDPKGREIVRNDDVDAVNEVRDSAIRGLPLPETGTYVIVATRYGQEFETSSGDFELAVTTATSDPSDYGFSQSISYDSQVTGTIDGDTPERYYTFRAAAGDVISIQMTHTSGDLDPRLSLTNNLGTEIFSNDDNMITGSIDAAIDRYIIPRSGYYTLVAQRYPGGETAGDYRLKLVRESQGASGLYAVLSPTNSTTINDEGAFYINFSAGDDVDENNEEHAFQTLLTFRLPPNETQTVESATFIMEPCIEDGGGFATLGALTVYQDSYGSLNEGRNVTRPLPGARVLSTQNTCDSVDLTSVVQNAYASGSRDVQLRLIFRSNTDNGETDKVFFTPSLLVTFGS